MKRIILSIAALALLGGVGCKTKIGERAEARAIAQKQEEQQRAENARPAEPTDAPVSEAELAALAPVRDQAELGRESELKAREALADEATSMIDKMDLRVTDLRARADDAMATRTFQPEFEELAELRTQALDGVGMIKNQAVPYDAAKTASASALQKFEQGINVLESRVRQATERQPGI